MMLEIIVLRSIEENFTTLVGEQHTSVPQEKIRRLSVHSGDERYCNKQNVIPCPVLEYILRWRDTAVSLDETFENIRFRRLWNSEE